MRALPEAFAPYRWAPSTDAIARLTGLDPVQVIRFDGNVPAQPPPSARPGTIAGALAEVNQYAHGGYPALVEAIAGYAGVAPENVVLGAGCDDLILLCARAFAGPGDVVAIPAEPTYPLYRVAAGLAGAEVVASGSEPQAPPRPGEAPALVERSASGSEPRTRRPVSERGPRVERGASGSEPQAPAALTFACRPGNPTGALDPLPRARPLAVDEAYFEYAGESAVGLIGDGVVVLRTFSKAFGLAGARVGYALADADTAAELNRRQAPLPVATLSAALALAALAEPPDVAAQVTERERLARALRALGLEPLPSAANFLFVPADDALAEALLRDGIVVRAFPGAMRISVRDEHDDDLLLDALARALDRPPPVARPGSRRARHLRATAETRIRVRLALDGAGRVRVATGAGLYDHLLEQLAFHGGLDLVLEGAGDLETGDHHTAEDAALALGEALDSALGDRRGIARYGDAVVPMDDALARAAVDLGGRPWAELALERDPGLAGHVLQSLAQAGRLALHVEATGRDEHHVAEAAFKAVGRALRAAVRAEGGGVPSTKGRL